MRKALVIMVALTVVGAFAGPAAAEEVVRVAGSGGPMVALRAAAQTFMKANPGVKVEVPESISTSGGIKAAGEGAAELGRVARRPNEKEKAYNLEYIEFAKSPVVFATHPLVKVGKLTQAQVRDLFNGTITNWNAVGGSDLKVRIIARPDGEANLEVIRKGLADWKSLVITAKSKVANTDQEMSQFIGENEGAIGFGPMVEAIDKNLGIVAIDGVKPFEGGYPLYGNWAFVYKAEKMAGAVKKFVDFVFSPEGAAILKANHATPIPR
jgi:phosphate transport system substrate-binding protein